MNKVYGELKGETWLIHNSGGISLTIVAGPFTKDKDWKEALIEYIRDSTNFEEDNDTMHTLSYDDDGPTIGDLSGGFMDAARVLADPDGYDQANITTATEKIYGE